MSVPKWQKHLQKLPAHRPSARLTPAERSRYAASYDLARSAGAPVRAIVRFRGCSVDHVVRLLEWVGAYNNLPVVRRAEEAIQGRIDEGIYRVRDVLPTAEQSGKELGVGENTAVRALTRLARKGLLLTVRSRGCVVVDPKAPPTGSRTAPTPKTAGSRGSGPRRGVRSHQSDGAVPHQTDEGARDPHPCAQRAKRKSRPSFGTQPLESRRERRCRHGVCMEFRFRSSEGRREYF